MLNYIDREISELLSDAPFSDWVFEKTEVTDVNPPETHYDFTGNGLGVRCDPENKIDVVFLYVDQGCDSNLFDIPFHWNREQVRSYFGVPKKSSDGSRHPVLGEIAAWDQFSIDVGSLHFEYSMEKFLIMKITIMRGDAIPI